MQYELQYSAWPSAPLTGKLACCAPSKDPFQHACFFILVKTKCSFVKAVCCEACHGTFKWWMIEVWCPALDAICMCVAAVLTYDIIIYTGSILLEGILKATISYNPNNVNGVQGSQTGDRLAIIAGGTQCLFRKANFKISLPFILVISLLMLYVYDRFLSTNQLQQIRLEFTEIQGTYTGSW